MSPSSTDLTDSDVLRGHAGLSVLPPHDVGQEQLELHPVTSGASQHDNGLLSPEIISPSYPLGTPPSSNIDPGPSHRSPAFLIHRLTPSTLMLKNSGSVARDHLASERTWLEYIRTSLAIAGTGVALVQVFAITASESRALQIEATNIFGIGASVQRFALPLGITTVFIGLASLSWRYFKIQKAMTQGLFPVSRSTIVVLTASLAMLVAITFGILVALP